jgi:predicted nucleic acid-binding protein
MLLDTSGLFCLHDRKEDFHERAVAEYGEAHVRLVHSYILAEFVALAQARRMPRGPALSFLADLLDNPVVNVVWVGEDPHREAIDLLLARPDKTYSLCDSVSFILMRRAKLADALSTDRHFKQEGFRRLLA